MIQPCARPTDLATLNRKRLAVDASIWIYQFLKAVRDKEGNALRNSHLVGFFRRICKLLWFGIKPVFVFDGGAPALKRATLQRRLRRREGRREDASRTAGKILALQMHRLAAEEEERRKRDPTGDALAREAQAQEEPLLESGDVGYLDEIGMTPQQKVQSRRFHKQDAYHLPELEGGIAAMANPDDPRIMSVDELEMYAKQFNNDEDVNLYDFSNIDFDGDFFKSLPPPDRYNILNAARLRSRLRMGLSKDQLNDMFPDRMAFSRFQIERVKERNHLTQRLMLEVGMQGTDLTLGVNARIAGDKDREYILVKNEGVEGGWALGVVSKDKEIGEAHKPIDVDAIQVQYQSKGEEEEEDEEDDDFEDVPIEGLNRLPKARRSLAVDSSSSRPRQPYHEAQAPVPSAGEDDGGEGSLFVGGRLEATPSLEEVEPRERMHPEEEEDIRQAIALSLQSQHGLDGPEVETQDPMPKTSSPPLRPAWAQKSAEKQKPISGGSGLAIARLVNSRASAAVTKAKEEENAAEADSDDDMQTLLARSRMSAARQAKPVTADQKSAFGGPLPFPKLNWTSSLFGKSRSEEKKAVAGKDRVEHVSEPATDLGGGFEIEPREEEEARPLPPWLVDGSDIREGLRKQQEREREINAEDREAAQEEERLRQRELRERAIEIESSSEEDKEEEEEEEDENQIQVVEISPTPEAGQGPRLDLSQDDDDGDDGLRQEKEATATAESAVTWQSELKEAEMEVAREDEPDDGATSRAEGDAASPEPEFEDVPRLGDDSAEGQEKEAEVAGVGEEGEGVNALEEDELGDIEYEDEFSEAEDEELMAQMAEEAEEHARFASELNHKSAEQNREEYERELRALRQQQKKDRRDADEVTRVMVTECQSLLGLFGIPYMTAPMEAEAQCAELVRLGLVDGIVTDDSDTFLFGGTRVYKNVFNSKKLVECYLSSDLEKELSLSRSELISLAQLLGSDYAEGLPGVGPVTAVEILSEFPGRTGLDQFRSWWTTVQGQGGQGLAGSAAAEDSSFRRKFRKSQGTKLFLPPGFPNPAVEEAYLQPEVDEDAEPFQWGVPDVEGLRRFLMATIGWTQERTDEVLVPVIRDMNRREAEGTQSNISRFFAGGVGAGARREARPGEARTRGSKRMAAAVDRLRARTGGEAEEAEEQEAAARKRRRRGERG